MSADLTIDTALADPMIRALMRADHVEPKSFERLLRSKAKVVEHSPRARVAAVAGVFAQRPFRLLSDGFCCA